MTFVIPNSGDAENTTQAQPDARDFSGILAVSPGLTGVTSGCAVTAQGSPNMTVAVAAGAVVVDGATALVTAGNVTITTADVTNDRFDLIVASNAGALSAVAGTPAVTPVFPDPAGKTVLAAVRVPANITSITSAKITDKRVFVAANGAANPMQTGSAQWYVPPGTVGTGAGVNGNLIAYPVWLPKGITITAIGAEVTTLTASSTMRLGIYKDSGLGFPDPLLIDGGTVATATTGFKSVTISQVTPYAGIYWLAMAPQGTGVATMRTLTNGSSYLSLLNMNTAGTPSGAILGYTVSGVTAAFTDPLGWFAGSTNLAVAPPRICLKVT